MFEKQMNEVKIFNNSREYCMTGGKLQYCMLLKTIFEYNKEFKTYDVINEVKLPDGSINGGKVNYNTEFESPKGYKQGEADKTNKHKFINWYPVYMRLLGLSEYKNIETLMTRIFTLSKMVNQSCTSQNFNSFYYDYKLREWFSDEVSNDVPIYVSAE